MKRCFETKQTAQLRKSRIHKILASLILYFFVRLLIPIPQFCFVPTTSKFVVKTYNKSLCQLHFSEKKFENDPVELNCQLDDDETATFLLCICWLHLGGERRNKTEAVQKSGDCFLQLFFFFLKMDFTSERDPRKPCVAVCVCLFDGNLAVGDAQSHPTNYTCKSVTTKPPEYCFSHMVAHKVAIKTSFVWRPYLGCLFVTKDVSIFLYTSCVVDQAIFIWHESAQRNFRRVSNFSTWYSFRRMFSCIQISTE